MLSANADGPRQGGWFDYLPFRVPRYPGLILQCRSPILGRVLVLDTAVYAYCIHEYTEPLSWRREWMYDNQNNPGSGYSFALTALLDWLDHSDRPEPRHWTRAIDIVDNVQRIRRLEP